jgi:hypothetical protein
MALRTQVGLAVRIDNPPSGAGIRLLGIVFAALALTAGAISLMINVSFGWQTSLVAAAVFGLSDGAKIVLPMAAAALGGWNSRRRIAWLVAVMISVAAALSSLLEDDAGRVQASQTVAEAASRARAEEAHARQQLAQITEAFSAQVLQKLADDAGAEAAREEALGGCGGRCRAQKTRRSDYLARLGVAERRDALQSEWAAAIRKAEARPVPALGAADALAALTGGDKFRIAAIINLALSIAMLVILELLASLSGDAMVLLRSTTGAPAIPARQSEMRQGSATEITRPVKVIANRAYYLARLERDHPLLAAQVHRGELSVHRASIEAGLRKPPAKPTSRSLTYASTAKATA